tara:strand:- start:22 stop:606 length:585 start_codon:yes stop_codon:yes gene_type:complete
MSYRNELEEINKAPYYCFIKGVKDRGYTMEQVKNWTYAGGFWGLGRRACPEINLEEDSRLRSKWDEVMGTHMQIPDDNIIQDCICDVHIKWAHLIVDDPDAEEPHCLIIGSECVRCYSNSGDGLKTYKKCTSCNAKHRNKKDLCKECKNIRVCKYKHCLNHIDKGKRDYCGVCRIKVNKQNKYNKPSWTSYLYL